MCVLLPRSSIITIMFIARNPQSPPTLYLPPPTSPSSLLLAFRAAARAPSTSTHPILIARAFASAYRHVVTSSETTSADSSQRLLKSVAAAADYRAPQELLVNPSCSSQPCTPDFPHFFHRSNTYFSFRFMQPSSSKRPWTATGSPSSTAAAATAALFTSVTSGSTACQLRS